MDSINKLTEIFSHFPGIGPRQAKRFVYHLLHRNEFANKELSDLILSLKKETRSCPFCGRFHKTDNDTACNICADPRRERGKLMVVAKDVDLENIERAGIYDGFYLVLGGLVPILDKNPEIRIRQRELLSKINSTPELKEIIIALSATTEGDHTADYLKQILSPFASERNIRISILGRGLSTGTELEYSDADTIKNALKNRE